jgi:hypothetical protein
MNEQRLSELSPERLEAGGDYANVALRDYELTKRGLGDISLGGCPRLLSTPKRKWGILCSKVVVRQAC